MAYKLQYICKVGDRNMYRIEENGGGVLDSSIVRTNAGGMFRSNDEELYRSRKHARAAIGVDQTIGDEKAIAPKKSPKVKF